MREPSRRWPYQYDVFISHNHGDDGPELAGRLREQGATVYCDALDDLRDQRVRAGIRQAHLNCRYILLFVGPQFGWTPWCKAEVLPSLSLEADLGGSTRVAVALTEQALLPYSLEGCRHVFRLPSDFSELADFIVYGNALPDELVDEIKRQESMCSAMSSRSIPDLFDKTPREFQLFEFMARILEHAASTSVSRRGSASSEEGVAEVLDHLATLSRHRRRRAVRAKALNSRRFRSAMGKWVRASDSDLRYNAKSIALSLARLRPELVSIIGCAEYIRSEPDPVLLRGLLRRWADSGLPADESTKLYLSASVCRAATTAEKFDKDFLLLADVPDPARIWASIRWPQIDIGELDVKERGGLLRKRLRVLKAEGHPVGGAALEIEGYLKELRDAFFAECDQEPGKKEARAELASTLSLVCDWADQSGYGGNYGGGLIDFTSLDWIEYTLIPMSRVAGMPDVSAPELDLFNRICRLIEQHDSWAIAVPVYRQLAAVLGRGAAWEQARSDIMPALLRAGMKGRDR